MDFFMHWETMKELCDEDPNTKDPPKSLEMLKLIFAATRKSSLK
jgi:hypothetical protein